MKIREIYKTYNVTKSNANEKRNQSAQPAKAKAKAKAKAIQSLNETESQW